MSFDEVADVVDEGDVVIGSATRAQIRAGGLRHRGVWVIVRDEADRVYIHRRTETKDVFPGLWDMVVGGLVLSGETYEQAAARELAEELGLAADLKFLERVSPSGMSWFAGVFEARCTGDVHPDPSEIAEGEFVAVGALGRLVKARPFIDGVYERVARFLSSP